MSRRVNIFTFANFIKIPVVEWNSLSALRSVGPEFEAGSGYFHAQMVPDRGFRVKPPPFEGDDPHLLAQGPPLRGCPSGRLSLFVRFMLAMGAQERVGFPDFLDEFAPVATALRSVPALRSGCLPAVGSWTGSGGA